MSAKLRFSYGTMSSGKSLQVLTTAYNLEERNIPFIILKSEIDTRDEFSQIKSRIGLSRDCLVVSITDNLYERIRCLKTSIKWVLVDECQFLTEKQIDQLSDVVDYLNIDVWCYGLRTDFKTHLFEGSKRLFEIADKIEELKSACDCGHKNIINAKINKDGSYAVGGAQIDIGGDEKYIAVCRKCYKEKMNKN